MKKLKLFLKWGLLSVILQCLVLFVFDKFYFKLNSNVNVKAIDIASQHTKENKDIKLPSDMLDRKISYDGEYVAYFNKNEELKVFDTIKEEEVNVDLENEKASYYTWLRDRNRLLVTTSTKGNNRHNTVNLYSVDVDSNKTKKIEIGNINSAYKVSEITASTKTGVIYIKFTNGDTKESIVKRIDNNDDVTDVSLVTETPGNVEIMPRADRLVYDSEKESGIYLTQPNKKLGINPAYKVRLLGVDETGNVYFGEMKEDKVFKIVYGDVEKPIDSWNKIPLDNSLDLKDIYIGEDGEIYVLESSQNLVKDIKNGKEYKYEGEFLQMYSDGFATIINGNKLHRIYFNSQGNK
ncbi:hypothetical protein QYB59_000900 [Clostridium perfringens]|nr:hypothetical protein [Clostridium perfringens]